MCDPNQPFANFRRNLMEQLPDIGTKISILSITESRYEGVLLKIDRSANTIAAGAVRSFGTEIRMAIVVRPPLRDIISYLIFKVNIIKDICVIHAFTPLPIPIANQQAYYMQQLHQYHLQQMHQQGQQSAQHGVQQQQPPLHHSPDMPIYVAPGAVPSNSTAAAGNPMMHQQVRRVHPIQQISSYHRELENGVLMPTFAVGIICQPSCVVPQEVAVPASPSYHAHPQQQVQQPQALPQRQPKPKSKPKAKAKSPPQYQVHPQFLQYQQYQQFCQQLYRQQQQQQQQQQRQLQHQFQVQQQVQQQIQQQVHQQMQLAQQQVQKEIPFLTKGAHRNLSPRASELFSVPEESEEDELEISPQPPAKLSLRPKRQLEPNGQSEQEGQPQVQAPLQTQTQEVLQPQQLLSQLQQPQPRPLLQPQMLQNPPQLQPQMLVVQPMQQKPQQVWSQIQQTQSQPQHQQSLSQLQPQLQPLQTVSQLQQLSPQPQQSLLLVSQSQQPHPQPQPQPLSALKQPMSQLRQLLPHSQAQHPLPQYLQPQLQPLQSQRQPQSQPQQLLPQLVQTQSQPQSPQPVAQLQQLVSQSWQLVSQSQPLQPQPQQLQPEELQLEELQLEEQQLEELQAQALQPPSQPMQLQPLLQPLQPQSQAQPRLQSHSQPQYQQSVSQPRHPLPQSQPLQPQPQQLQPEELQLQSEELHPQPFQLLQEELQPQPQQTLPQPQQPVQQPQHQQVEELHPQPLHQSPQLQHQPLIYEPEFPPQLQYSLPLGQFEYDCIPPDMVDHSLPRDLSLPCINQVEQGLPLRYPLFGSQCAAKDRPLATKKSFVDMFKSNSSEQEPFTFFSERMPYIKKAKGGQPFDFNNLVALRNSGGLEGYKPYGWLHDYETHRKYTPHSPSCYGRANYASVCRSLPSKQPSQLAISDNDFNLQAVNKNIEKLMLDEAAGGLPVETPTDREQVPQLAPTTEDSQGKRIFCNKKSSCDESLRNCESNVSGKENMNAQLQSSAWCKVPISISVKKSYMASRPSNMRGRGNQRGTGRQSRYTALSEVNDDC